MINRRPLSESLLDQLATGLRNRQTALVVAPAYGGKSVLARRVAKRLDQASVHLFTFEFPTGHGIDDPVDAFKSLHPQKDLATTPTTASEFFGRLRELSQRSGKPAVVILNHLDGLSIKLAEEFLKPFFPPDSEAFPNCAALITTESHVFELFWNPSAKFKSTNTFLLQGLDLPIFQDVLELGKSKFYTSFGENVPIGWLWNITGGNTFLSLELVWAYGYAQLLKGEPTNQYSLTQKDVEEMAAKLTRPGLEECPLFREVAETIGSNTEYLQDLGQLIANGSYDPGSAFLDAPHPLEVVGVAYYVDRRLRFSSNLMEKFVRQEFTDRRFGHFYALLGDWDQAFHWYKRSPKRVQSTLTLRERLILEEVLRRLRQALLQAKPDQMRYLFETFAKHVFGVDPSQLAQSRSPLHQEAEIASNQITDSLTQLMKDYREALISYHHSQEELRAQHLRRVLTNFMKDVINNLYLQEASPETVLSQVTDDLVRSEALADAVFWLLSEDRQTLRRVPPASYQPVQIALSPKSRDHLLEVALGRTSASQSVDEAQWSANERQPWARETNKNGCALLRLGTNLLPLGAFYVAMPQGRLPTQAELAELEQFASQLSEAVLRADELRRISEGLNSLQEPIVLLDTRRQVKLSNSAARHLLSDLQAGGDFDKGINYALKGKRFLDFPTRIAGKPYEGTVAYEPLLSKEECIIGVLVHVQQKSHYAGVVDVMQALYESVSQNEALSKLVEILQQIGHEWVRVYRVNRNTLEPAVCCDPKRPEVAANFSKVQLPVEDSSLTWRAIIDREAKVVSFSRDRPSGQEFLTPNGLPVIAEPDPPAADLLGKKPGDLWLDLPLVNDRGDRYGKITVSCDQNMPPERLQVMRLLAEVSGKIIIEIGKREGLSQEMRSAEQQLAAQRGSLVLRLGPLQIMRQIIENVMGDLPVANHSAPEFCELFDIAFRDLRESIENLGSNLARPVG